MTERTAKALRKMLMHTERVLQYATKDWVKDALRVDAIVFNLSQIGELVRLVDEETQAMHPQIPWAAMRGFRNRIVHDYDSITVQYSSSNGSSGPAHSCQRNERPSIIVFRHWPGKLAHKWNTPHS